jgi:hypothetical protein
MPIGKTDDDLTTSGSELGPKQPLPETLGGIATCRWVVTVVRAQLHEEENKDCKDEECGGAQCAKHTNGALRCSDNGAAAE